MSSTILQCQPIRTKHIPLNQSEPVLSSHIHSYLVVCEGLGGVEVEAEDTAGSLKHNDLVSLMLGDVVSCNTLLTNQKTVLTNQNPPSVLIFLSVTNSGKVRSLRMTKLIISLSLTINISHPHYDVLVFIHGALEPSGFESSYHIESLCILWKFLGH